jgi:hypothetical protein
MLESLVKEFCFYPNSRRQVRDNGKGARQRRAMRPDIVVADSGHRTYIDIPAGAAKASHSWRHFAWA